MRLGGHLVDGVQYGVENEVYGNFIYGNQAGGVKILVGGQGRVCDNMLWDNAAGDVIGSAAADYDPAAPCDSAE